MDRQVTGDGSQLDGSDDVQDRADAERAERDAEHLGLAPQDDNDGVDQADRVQRSGHAEPKDAHFVHGRVSGTSIG